MEKKLKTREGDKKDEYLLLPHELKSAYFISLNKTKLIAIDKSKNNLKIFKKNITSENSLKLTNKEIMNLIKIKPKLKEELLTTIIMAAGRGMRMMPLTAKKPKAMAKLNGNSLISHNIYKLSNKIVNIQYYCWL